tara:strand:+ start:216 stop:401 length:186 start_codon:yes stop_codon:yes gene_type:complete
VKDERTHDELVKRNGELAVINNNLMNDNRVLLEKVKNRELRLKGFEKEMRELKAKLAAAVV